MGFMDKAKKMAEQAQAKIDEAQKQFNTGQPQGQPPGEAVEFDQHGRPVRQDPPASASPPHGDPLAPPSAPPPPAEPPTPTPGVPPTGQGDPVTAPPPPPAPPAEPAAPPVEQPGVPPTAEEPPGEDRNNPSYAPPKLSSGDPLAG